MDGSLVAWVLAGALLHAGWNALVKAGRDKALDTALVHLMAAAVALPALVWTGPPVAATLPFVLGSMAIHTGYYIALAGAYRHGDLGLTYPIMRGVAPLLVALGSATWIGEAPSGTAWLGILGVALGVAMVGLPRPGRALQHGKAVGYALANACIIAAYTVVDGLGVRTEVAEGGQALRYVLMLFVVDGLPYAMLLWLRRGPSGRPALWAYAQRRWPVATLGGAASIGAYAIALWAMTQAPVASVAALRETSVLFATLIGAWLLKEPLGRSRALGAATIVAGVVALRLG